MREKKEGETVRRLHIMMTKSVKLSPTGTTFVQSCFQITAQAPGIFTSSESANTAFGDYILANSFYKQ